jgi:hypothetical protein
MAKTAYQNFMDLQNTLSNAEVSMDGRVALVSKECFIALGGTEAEWDALQEEDV